MSTMVGIGVATATLSLMIAPRGVGISGDSVAYLSAARAIAEGSPPVVSEQRPVGFSLAMAPLMMYGEVPARLIRVLLAGCWVAAGAMAFDLHRRWIGDAGAMTVGLLVATSGVLMEQTRWTLSEPVFCVALLAALWVMEGWARRGAGPSARAVAVGALLAGVATTVRSVGAVLVACGCAAVLAGAGSARRRMILAGGFVAMALAVPLAANQASDSGAAESGYWHWMTHARPSERTSATGFPLAIERARRLAPLRLVEVAECIVPRTLGWRLWATSIGRGAAIAIGAGVMLLVARRLILKNRVSDAFALFYFAVLVFWPWDEGVRLVAPLIPIFLGVLVETAIEIGRGIRPWRAGLAGAVGLAALVLAMHFAEFGTVMLRARADGVKFAARMTRGEAIAAQLRGLDASHARVVGLIPDGDDAKVDFELGAYLARRHVETIDWRAGMEPAKQLTTAEWVFAHRRTASSLAQQSKWRAASAVLDYVVFERTEPTGVAAR